MNMKRRSKTEVMIDIMKIADVPIRPTRLLALSNTCHKQFQVYFNKLRGLGFLESYTLEGETRSLIRTTDKGKEFTRRISRLTELIN